MFFRKDVLRNFTKFTGKHLYQNLFFDNVADLRPVTHVFSVNFTKFLRTPPDDFSGESLKDTTKAYFLLSS